MASALKAEGAQVLILTLVRGGVWESRLEAIGIPVEFVGASASRLGRLAAICRAARRFHPGVVQSQHFFMNAYGAITARLCGSRSVGAVRNDGFSDKRDCGRGFGRLCLGLPQRLAVNSQAGLRNLLSLGLRRERLFHLPNVIDMAQFGARESSSGEGGVILGTGRLVPQKRFDRFLRIIAILEHSCIVSFRGLIVGEGALRPELEQATRDFGLCPGRVEFTGSVTDMRAIYNKAQILLLTSDHEGTPNVVMEAMASGLPVVATAVGDVPDLVRQGVSGFVVAPSDEHGAAEHLRELVSNPALARSMGARGCAFIESHHALGTLPGRLAALYAEKSE